MRCSVRGVVRVGALLVAGVVGLGETGRTGEVAPEVPSYELGFEAPSCGGELSGVSGSVVEREVSAVLRTLSAPRGAPGAQAWQVVVAAENAELTSITTDGTDAAGPAEPTKERFELTELVESGEGDVVALSVIVLSFVDPVTLPVEGSPTIARVGVALTFPEVPGRSVTARVHYATRDLRPALDEETRSVVVWEGFEAGVVVTDCAIRLSSRRGPAPCDGRVTGGAAFFFQDRAIGGREGQQRRQSAELFANAVDSPVPDDGGESGEEGVDELRVGPGRRVVWAALTSNLGADASGVQGWSLSVRSRGSVRWVDATTDGTATAEIEDGGLRQVGFSVVGVVDPATGGQGAGVVAAAVLSLRGDIALLPVGTATVLAMELAGDGGDEAELTWEDGLLSGGEPVENALTVEGERVEVDCARGLRVIFDEAVAPSFVRGEVNDDGRVDIGDAIATLLHLFRGGEAPGCEAAADVNADGRVDGADPMYALEYLLLGGEPIPAPTACGDFPESPVAPEDCESPPSACHAGTDA